MLKKHKSIREGILFTFKKNKTEKLFDSKNEDVNFHDQLFFHDMINLTHGLLLFIDQRNLSNNTLSSTELLLIKSEIKTLQSLLRDHFKMKHKNLLSSPSFIDVYELKNVIHSLIGTYLKEKPVNTSIIIDPGAEKVFSIQFSIFYRICNNLIKNISESDGSQIDLKFLVTISGLKIESSNTLKEHLDSNLPEYLERVILNEKKIQSDGLGIESIHQLTKDCGGTFNFEIQNNTWINRVFLPNLLSREDKNASKKAA